MNFTGLFNSFANALASGLGTFLALRAGGWFFDGRKNIKQKVEDKK
jgi:hypothetical protein